MPGRTRGTTETYERAVKRAGAKPYVLELYVSGATSKSVRAISNLRKICDEFLTSGFELKVIDVYREPALATQEQIVAVPTLLKRSPGAKRKLIGDLSDTEKVLKGLGILRGGREA